MTKRYFLSVMAACILASLHAQVSEYTFTAATGAYSPLSSATVWLSASAITSDTVSDEITLPFVFNFNNRNYSTVRINANGFLQFGTTYPNPSGEVGNPLGNSVSNTAGAYEGAVAASAQGLTASTMPGASAAISYVSTSSEFAVQYKDVATKWSPSTHRMNFQIRLQQGTNKIVFVYGNYVAANFLVGLYVGLRGAFGDVSNRVNAATNNWLNTSRGQSAFDVMGFNASAIPPIGATYTWMPPVYNNTAPAFAALPFHESFDLAWVDYDNTQQLPNGSNWRTWPARGVTAWRRHDADAGFSSSSGWLTLSPGFVAPRAGYAARLSWYPAFMSIAPLPGIMDVHLNFSAPGNKHLQLEYFGNDASDSVVVLLSTDNGITFERKGVITGAANNWILHQMLLGNDTSSTTVLRLVGYAMSDIGLDNLDVVTENCGFITGLNTSNVSANSVMLHWDTIAGVSNYAYEVRTSGLPGSGAAGLAASGTAAGSSVNGSGLMPSTAYTFYIRSAATGCTWSLPASFRTLCDAANVPYTEDFSSAFPPYLDYCERTQDSLPNMGWKLTNSGVPGMSLNYALSAKENSGSWFFTRGINLTAGTQYSISFKYYHYQSTLKCRKRLLL